MNAQPSGQRNVPLIDIPQDLLPSKNKSDMYRTLVAAALKHNLNPAPVDIAGMERATLFLNPLLAAKINVVAQEHKISFQEAFAGLSIAGMRQIKDGHRALAQVAATIDMPFKTSSQDQIAFYQGIHAGLSQNKIVIAEGSTGLGKGLALCAAAQEAAFEGKTPVVITAPTLQVLGQLWQQMQLLVNGGIGIAGREYAKTAFFPGASEFVNETKLKKFMEDHIEDDVVAEWVRQEGAMLDSTNPLRAAMIESGIKPSWLMEDLKKLAINMPVTDFGLKSEDECFSLDMLDSLRQHARGADIVFCTHAMLAYSQMTDWRLVPEPAVLLIDEAHQFEQSVANCYSTELSLYSLKGRVEKNSKSPSALSKSIQDFINFTRSDKLKAVQNVNLKTTEEFDVLHEMISKIASHIKSKSHEKVPNIKEDRFTISNIVKAMNDESTDTAILTFSPDRRFPSLQTGKNDIGKILGGLWKTVTGGVVLASATLYIQDEHGNNKCDYISDILSLPGTRTYTPPPVTAKWVTSVPVLHYPINEQCALLSRPSARGEEAESQWIKNNAERIVEITSQTNGGTLVLTTSYAQITALHREMMNLGVDENRIIIQRRDHKISVTEQIFRDAHAKGLKPIWLGLGAAWTGLDVRDKTVDAKDDTLLLNLIITCLPIGVNRSNTMMNRIKKGYSHKKTDAINIQPIIKEALMMLKQGLGRIMRDQNQTGRHIWILDGRIWTPWAGMTALQNPAKRMLSAYKNVQTF